MRRRTLVAGLGALLVVAGGAAWKLHFFRKQYPPTPYDDLLARLQDREWAAKFGEMALPALSQFTPARAASELRSTLKNRNLKDAALADARAGRLVEAGGWLVPRSVALMAALAGSVA
jgi:hypothetical protein